MVNAKRMEGLKHSPLSDLSTRLPLSPHSEYTFVLQIPLAMAIRQLGERRMRLYEHGCIERYFEELTKLLYALLFRFPAAIGEKDEGDAVGLEIREGVVGTGKGFRGAKENTVDAVTMLAGFARNASPRERCTQMRTQSWGFWAESFSWMSSGSEGIV